MKFNKKIILVSVQIAAVLFIFISADYAVFKKLLRSSGFSYAPMRYISGYTYEYEPQSYTGIEDIINGRKKYFRHHINTRENAQKSADKSTAEEKGSILLFGCSYTYGSGLQENRTLSAQLSEYTGRKAYNFGIEGGGAQHMLHLLRNEAFFNNYLQNARPEYAVYTYIPNHLDRLKFNVFPNPLYSIGFNLRYELKNNGMKNVSAPLFMSFFGRNYLIKSAVFNIDSMDAYSLENKYKRFAEINEIFSESKKLLEEKYPGIKFVILKMTYKDEVSQDMELPFMRAALEKQGFIFLDSKELAGREFEYGRDTVSDNIHPSAEVWNILVPRIVEKLYIK